MYSFSFFLPSPENRKLSLQGGPACLPSFFFLLSGWMLDTKKREIVSSLEEEMKKEKKGERGLLILLVLDERLFSGRGKEEKLTLEQPAQLRSRSPGILIAACRSLERGLNGVFSSSFLLALNSGIAEKLKIKASPYLRPLWYV